MKKYYAHCFTILSFSFLTCTANAFQLTPIVTLGGGVSGSSDVGHSQYFPATNPGTNEFYQYSINHRFKSQGLGTIGVGAEWKLSQHWLAQTALEYAQTSYLAKGVLTQGIDSDSQDAYDYQYKIISKQLMAEIKFLYDLGHSLHPYWLAGVGASFNHAYHFSTTVPPTLTFTRQYANQSTTALSYTTGIGVDMDIAPQLRLGVGYRFSDLGKVSLGQASIDGAPASGTLSQSHLYVNQLLAQLTYRFQ